jgi:hypothetical protein
MGVRHQDILLCHMTQGRKNKGLLEGEYQISGTRNEIIKRKQEEGMHWPGSRAFQGGWRHFLGMMGHVVRLLPNNHVPRRAASI